MKWRTQPLFQAQPNSNSKRKLTVMAEGGAVCAEHRGDREYRLGLDVVESLCEEAKSQMSASLSGRLETYDIVERPGGMVSGRDMYLEEVAELTRRLQTRFQQGLQHVILLVSSHAAPCVAAAAAMALRPEYFGHDGSGEVRGEQSSLLIASSRFPGHSRNGPNGADALADSMEGMLKHYMDGRIGVLFNGKIYPPYHLVRPQDPTDFRTGLTTNIASKGDGDRLRFNDITQEHIPWGDDDTPFTVNPRVRVFSLADGSTNREEVTNSAFAVACPAANPAEKMNGLVLETAASGDPVASCQHPDVLKSFDDMHVPVLVTSQRVLSVGDTDGHVTKASPPTRYRHVESAGNLRAPEAKVALARWLAEARQAGCGDSLTKTMQFVRGRLENHPFLY